MSPRRPLIAPSEGRVQSISPAKGRKGVERRRETATGRGGLRPPGGGEIAAPAVFGHACEREPRLCPRADIKPPWANSSALRCRPRSSASSPASFSPYGWRLGRRSFSGPSKVGQGPFVSDAGTLGGLNFGERFEDGPATRGCWVARSLIVGPRDPDAGISPVCRAPRGCPCGRGACVRACSFSWSFALGGVDLTVECGDEEGTQVRAVASLQTGPFGYALIPPVVTEGWMVVTFA